MTLSAKYNMIYPPLVARIIVEESGKKDPLKAAKTRMHQLYGAYLNGNAHKKASVLLNEMKTEEILLLHASTKERLPYHNEFYNFITETTETVQTVLDLGCGFHPFGVPFAPQAYHAYDIDLRTQALLNRFFTSLGLPAVAKCADLITETPAETVDLAFMLKLIPVLNAQAPERGYALANALYAKFIVISYPAKSLGGHEKGMGKNYTASFKNAVSNGLLNNFSLLAHKRIGNELIYIIARV